MLQLNIGCGPSGQIPGFVNIDNSRAILLDRAPVLKKLLFQMGLLSELKYRADWSGVVRMDASAGLRYPSESVDRIYSSHFLEHIPREKGKLVLHECFRVLKPGGVLRIVVPDLLYYATKYVNETQALLVNGVPTPDSDAHDRFLWTVYGAYLGRSRYGLEHCYMYDSPTLAVALSLAGFRQVSLAAFKTGVDMTLAQCDSRPEDSIHMDAVK